MSTATIAPPAAIGAPLRATVPLADLRRAVTFAMQAVPRRPPIMVLLGLLLEAEGGTLRVTGFDYEMRATDAVSAPGASGRALVPAAGFAAMLRVMPKGSDVVIESDGKRLTMRAGDRDLYRMPLLPIEDYPALPPLGPEIARLSPATLGVLTRVAVAAGRDDTLPVLTGVLLQPGPDGKGMSAAATDRYRLAVVDLDVEWPATALVPVGSLLRAERGMRDAREIVVHHRTDEIGYHSLSFVAGERVLSTRLLEGEFPKYRSLLPDADAMAGAMRVDRDVLHEAAFAASEAATRHAPIRLTMRPDAVVIEGGSDVEHEMYVRREIDATVDAVTAEEPFEIALNPAYVLAGLRSLLAGTVAVHRQGNAHRPIVMQHPDDPAYRYLLMPVRLSG